MAFRHQAPGHEAPTHTQRCGSLSVSRAACPAHRHQVASTALSQLGTPADRQSSSDHPAVRLAYCRQSGPALGHQLAMRRLGRICDVLTARNYL